MNVYLAGTISQEPRHLAWRELLTDKLAGWGHQAVSPLRYQDPRNFKDDGLHDVGTPSRFFVRCNTADLERCDIVFMVFWKGMVNHGYREAPKSGILLPQQRLTNEYRRQSIGTWCEFWHSVLRRIPVIVVTDDDDVAKHPYIDEHAAFITDDFEQGVERLKQFLLPTLPRTS